MSNAETLAMASTEALMAEARRRWPHLRGLSDVDLLLEMGRMHDARTAERQADGDARSGVDWSEGSRTDPADCMPWCQHRGEGHWPAGLPFECSTFGEEITLSVGIPVEADVGVWVPDFMHVYLWKTNDEPITVNMSHHEMSGQSLTVPEARELIAHLTRLVELASRELA